MAQPDAALGFDVDFDDQEFRRAIKFAQQMGKPNELTKAPRFVKKASGSRYFLGEVEQFQPPDGTLRLDRDGKPLNPNIRIVPVEDQVIADVDCSVEIHQADADEIPVGKFRPVKAEVTLLDVEYVKIKGCQELLYNGDRYRYGYEPEIPALFGVDSHVIIYYALDES